MTGRFAARVGTVLRGPGTHCDKTVTWRDSCSKLDATGGSLGMVCQGQLWGLAGAHGGQELGVAGWLDPDPNCDIKVEGGDVKTGAC